MNGEFPYDETDSLMRELREAAFEYLMLNPGSELGDWQQGLINEYPDAVVDALGTNPAEALAGLSDLWEREYEDPKTGLCQDFKEWAEAFSNESAVEIYYHLVNACSKLRQIGIKFPL